MRRFGVMNISRNDVQENHGLANLSWGMRLDCLFWRKHVVSSFLGTFLKHDNTTVQHHWLEAMPVMLGRPPCTRLSCSR